MKGLQGRAERWGREYKLFKKCGNSRIHFPVPSQLKPPVPVLNQLSYAADFNFSISLSLSAHIKQKGKTYINMRH